MKRKKHPLCVLIAVLAVLSGSMAVFSTTALAHCGGHSRRSAALSLCSVADCHTAAVHPHWVRYYSGHSIGDGHEHHVLCSVEGCSITEGHLHDGAYYFGHFANDGHTYHVACGVTGCTELTKHTHHRATTGGRGRGCHH